MTSFDRRFDLSRLDRIEAGLKEVIAYLRACDHLKERICPWPDVDPECGDEARCNKCKQYHKIDEDGHKDNPFHPYICCKCWMDSIPF